MDYKKKYLKYKMKYLMETYQHGGKEVRLDCRGKDKQNSKECLLKQKNKTLMGQLNNLLKTSTNDDIDKILNNYIKNEEDKKKILELSETLNKHYDVLDNLYGKHSNKEVSMIPTKIMKVLVEAVKISKESLSNNIFKLTKFKNSTKEEQEKYKEEIFELKKYMDVEFSKEDKIEQHDIIKIYDKLDKLNDYYDKFSEHQGTNKKKETNKKKN